MENENKRVGVYAGMLGGPGKGTSLRKDEAQSQPISPLHGRFVRKPRLDESMEKPWQGSHKVK